MEKFPICSGGRIVFCIDLNIETLMIYVSRKTANKVLSAHNDGMLWGANLTKKGRIKFIII
jgi:hypothetical protein